MTGDPLFLVAMRVPTLFTFLLALSACLAPATDPRGNAATALVGRVEEVTGQPSVIHDATLVNIGPRSTISIGDTLLANPGGSARIRMTDGTSLHLRDNAQLTIQQYGKDGVVMTCSAGTVVIDPGRFARQASHAFTITTPLATIIPRKGRFWMALNTELMEVILLEDGALRVMNHLGSQDLTLENEASSISFTMPPTRQLAQSLPL